MRCCSPLPFQWHRYSITTFDARSSRPHHCDDSSRASSPASSEASPAPFICLVHRNNILLFYLYPHVSAPLRVPRSRNWLSVVSLTVPCCYYHRMYLLVPENAFCTLSVDHSVSVIQSSTEGLEEGSQLLDGSTPAVNYQIHARSSSQNSPLLSVSLSTLLMTLCEQIISRAHAVQLRFPLLPLIPLIQPPPTGISKNNR